MWFTIDAYEEQGEEESWSVERWQLFEIQNEIESSLRQNWLDWGIDLVDRLSSSYKEENSEG